MKKILHSVLPYISMILILCIAIYYVGFHKKEVEQSEINEMNTIISSNTLGTALEDHAPGTGTTPDDEITSNDSELYDEANTIPLSRETFRSLSAGTMIDINGVDHTLMETFFYYEEITADIKARIVGKSYGDNCTVPFEDLKYVRILYYGFDEETHLGELIVNTAIAGDIVDIFAELYDAKYPIEQMVLVDEYNADDNASMAANNSSSFNYRLVPDATQLSKHAFGLAIDINPLYNPFVQFNENETLILPTEGIPYADRSLDCPYYIKEDDICYKAFTKRGFTWGGFWKSKPDYQHFQKTTE